MFVVIHSYKHQNKIYDDKQDIAFHNENKKQLVLCGFADKLLYFGTGGNNIFFYVLEAFPYDIGCMP